MSSRVASGQLGATAIGTSMTITGLQFLSITLFLSPIEYLAEANSRNIDPLPQSNTPTIRPSIHSGEILRVNECLILREGEGD